MTNLDRVRRAFVAQAINADVPRTYKVRHLVAMAGKPSDAEVLERVGVKEGDPHPQDPGALALRPLVVPFRPGIHEVLVTYMSGGNPPPRSEPAAEG